MKVPIAAACLMYSAVVFQGCSRTAVKPPDTNGGCIPKYPGKKITYDDYVKKILYTYCVSCHYGSGSAPGDFQTYKGVLPYVEAFNIRVLPDNADMPQGNAPLPESIRDSLAVWIDNCTPEN